MGHFEKGGKSARIARLPVIFSFEEGLENLRGGDGVDPALGLFSR